MKFLRRFVSSFGLAWLVLFVVWAPNLASSEVRPVEFWTIEPNEGQSSGGHSAIRIGETVYHVEHRGDGLIADRREGRDGFERVYRRLGNRSIDVLELGLPPQVEDKLEGVLRRRYFERRIRLERLAEVEEDLAWLDGGLAAGRFEVSIPGLGLFREGAGDCLSQEAAGLATRKRKIVERLGPGWLEGRVAQVRLALYRELAASVGARGFVRAENTIAEENAGGRTRRIVEIAQMLGALEALRSCRLPRSDRLVPLALDREKFMAGWSLSPSAHSGLLGISLVEKMEKDLIRLIKNEQFDSGLAILLTWGRLAARDVSMSRGITIVFDSIGDEEPTRGRERARVPSQWREAHKAEANARLLNRVGALALAENEGIEARLFDVEVARHFLEHARSGEIHVGPKAEPWLRVTKSLRHPAATMSLAWPAELSFRDLKARRIEMADRVRKVREKIQADLGYELFSRNCVTELMTAFDEAMTVNPSTASFRKDRLWDREAIFSFVPVVASRIMNRHLPVIGIRRLPSWRSAALGRRSLQGFSGFLDRLEESNTLSSTSYPSNSQDSTFLFFSQHPIWMRPLFGVANLATGLGATAIGLLRIPFDRARSVRRGLYGMLMSVPELFFFNVRKGSYVIEPPAMSQGLGRRTYDGDGT